MCKASMVKTYSILQSIDNAADSVKLSIPKGAEYEKIQTHKKSELYKNEIKS